MSQFLRPEEQGIAAALVALEELLGYHRLRGRTVFLEEQAAWYLGSCDLHNIMSKVVDFLNDDAGAMHKPVISFIRIL